MKRKFYFSFLAFALALAATVALVVGHSTRASSPNTALSALPASDFIVSVDVQRALNEMLPNLLYNNPELMAKVNSSMKEFEDQTGISPHVFESVAVGGSLNSAATPGQHDSSGVVILRGSFKSDELLNSAFAAASKKCDFQKEEQQYEGKTIYIIGPVRPVKDAGKGVTAHASQEPAFSYHVMPSGSDKFAVAAVDANTIAVGSPSSVRAAIDASLGRNRVDDELVRLASQTPNAVVSFSGRVPQNATVKAVSAGDNPVAK